MSGPLKTFQIGNIKPRNKVILAPMSEYTDRTFRRLCLSFDAGLVFTEMIHATRLVHGNPRTKDIARVDDQEGYGGLTVYQLVGSNIDHMREAARMLETAGAEMLDLNMGCPDADLKALGAGVYLSSDIDKAKRLAKSVVDAVHVPVTAKIRLGVNQETVNFRRLGLALEEAGISAVTLHPRTGVQRLTGPSYWQHIKELKQALHIPVIGNGDIMGLDDAKEMLRSTKCDAIMIGRGALRTPHLFRQVACYLADGTVLPPQTYEDKARMVLEHAEMLVAEKGPGTGMQWVRRFLAFYLQDLVRPGDLPPLVKGVTRMSELKKVLEHRRALDRADIPRRK